MKLLETIKNTATTVVYETKKHSPEILVVAGVIGTVASAVMACRATTKLSDILDESKETVDAIHKAPEDEDLKDKYTEEDMKKDLAITYAQTGFKIAKLYAPAVILGTLSISGILASNNILRKRNIALAAAYSAVDKGFKEYRNRVVQRFGEEVDYELFNNVHKEDVTVTKTDENGKEKKVKEKVDVADINNSNPYVKYFTRSNPYWDNCTDYIEMFLRAQQNYANDRLKAEKVLTLNDVYESLGFEKTKAGMVVGWVFDKDNPVGDNYVEFQVHKVYIPSENGEKELAYAIDFNVDGNIYNYMN